MISIKLIKKISEFLFSSSLSKNEIASSHSGEEIHFPPRASQKQITIKDVDEKVTFTLTNYGEDIKHFIFKEGLFTRDELILLSKTFNFNTILHPYSSQLLIGSLQFKNESYKTQCFGAITKKRDSFYLIIFAQRGSTLFEDDIIYVHGIWKVELSESFKTNIFQK